MLAGAVLVPVALVNAAVRVPVGSFPVLLGSWFGLWAATSLILTPSARLLRKASHEQNRSAVFAAQFSLSLGCFMLTYPLAGVLGATIGLPGTALVLAGLAAVGAAGAVRLWPTGAKAAVSPLLIGRLTAGR